MNSNSTAPVAEILFLHTRVDHLNKFDTWWVYIPSAVFNQILLIIVNGSNADNGLRG